MKKSVRAIFPFFLSRFPLLGNGDRRRLGPLSFLSFFLFPWINQTPLFLPPFFLFLPRAMFLRKRPRVPFFPHCRAISLIVMAYVPPPSPAPFPSFSIAGEREERFFLFPPFSARSENKGTSFLPPPLSPRWRESELEDGHE